MLFTVLLFCVGLESEFQFKGIRLFLFCSVCFLFFVIQGFNTWSPDFENYIVHFEDIDNEYVGKSLEPMHIFLVYFVKAIGGNFTFFFTLYGFLIILFYMRVLNKLSPLPVFVLANFFLIPFFPNIVQIRFFLGMAFFMNAVLYEKNRFKFFVFLLLAILSHYSFLVFLPFLILRKFSFFEDLKKNIVIVSVIAGLLFLVPNSLIEPYLVLINEKYVTYLDSNNSFSGTIVLFLPFFLANIFTLYHYKKKYYKYNDYIPVRYRQFIPIIIQLIHFSNYLILVQYFIRDFSRMSMNLYVLNLIYFSIILSFQKGNFDKQRAFIYKALIFVWTLVCFSISFFLLNQGEYFEIIQKTFESNSIYGWLA